LIPAASAISRTETEAGPRWANNSVAAASTASSSTAAQESLPRQEQPFKGQQGRTWKDSKPDFPQPVKAPPGAPNVLLILLDDVGFGQTRTFGGPVATPALDHLAANGLRYNRFHTTALCSPTRAALLAGPFDRWPTGLGFEYFYGFFGGDTSQWDPDLVENTSRIEKPRDQKDYHLTTAMADKAIAWLRQQKTIAPDKPFFVYFAPGAAHAPHHAPQEWIDRSNFDVITTQGNNPRQIQIGFRVEFQVR
jgi:arylsulfatase